VVSDGHFGPTNVREFAVAGPTAWNFLPDHIIQSDNGTCISSFIFALKTFCLRSTNTRVHWEFVFQHARVRYTNLHLRYITLKYYVIASANKIKKFIRLISVRRLNLRSTYTCVK